MAGRKRAFDEDEVLDRARDLFIRSGYRGVSVGDLLAATGLQRASLYNAFGSKQGLFLAVWHRSMTPAVDRMLLLVAASDLAPHDPEIRKLVAAAVQQLGAHNAVEELGSALLRRAGIPHDPTREIND